MGTITQLQIHDIFDNAVNKLRSLNPVANDMSTVKTKLDEVEALAVDLLVGNFPDDENAANQGQALDEKIAAQKNEIKKAEDLKSSQYSQNQSGLLSVQDKSQDQPVVNEKHSKKKH